MPTAITPRNPAGPPPRPGGGPSGVLRFLGACALVAATPVIVTAGAAIVLPVIGFTSAGVAAGSIAAGVQSAVYGGATCGVFSLLQSAGATIAAPAAMEVVAALGTAAMGARMIQGGGNGDGEEGEDGDGDEGGDDGDDEGKGKGVPEEK
ncbi:hypothetical protein C8Q79DRAFT_1005936 [Trametes meyenii]|nr:hypothetical protein C8Q79DRAFT_1005936 [Trametes meyenii]